MGDNHLEERVRELEIGQAKTEVLVTNLCEKLEKLTNSINAVMFTIGTSLFLAFVYELAKLLKK